MVPQNNYTLKHNSLPKSSSWKGAHWLLAYGKHERPPYYSSKPKANEVRRFENSHCGGRAMSKTHSDNVSPSSPFPENLWENETLQLKPGDRQRGSTKNNIDTLTFDVCSFPHLNQFGHDLQQQAFPELHPDSRILLAHIHQKLSSGAHGGLIEMAKWVLAEPTTDTASAWVEVISPCSITLFSDILWNSNTWLSIDGFTCLNH